MSWDRIRGQAAALASFRAAVDRGRLGQAYLLVGPDGVGKRLFATELAKSLLCDKPPGPLDACGSCPSCAQVAAGTHPDVFTLATPEGKHELPVEEMRGFCARMALKPTRGRRKVGIVLDADDFNEESANGFLKTLEEPAPGSLLLLLATGTDQQLPTILSRCQVVRFAPLGPDDLRAILEAEGVAADQLDRLVQLGGGSAGRALALADEAVWELRRKLVEGVTATRVNFGTLAEAWQRFYEDAGKDTAAQRLRVSLAVGFLVEVVRNALRLSLGADAPGLDPDEDHRLRDFAERLGPSRLVELAGHCVEADAHVARRVQLILVVESVLEHFARTAPARA